MTDILAIDNIGQSTLFTACVRGAKLDNPIAARNFHVAIWYEDLIALDKQGFVDGIQRLTERGWEEDRWQRLAAKAPKGARMGYVVDGQFIPIEPDFDSYDDDPRYREFIEYRNDRLSVTCAGRHFVSKELAAERNDFMERLGERVADLFQRQYYDTCIREACVQLEHEIRLHTGTDAYGDSLVEQFIEKARSGKYLLESEVRSFRQELRTVFKFIRNDFIHNLRDADSTATLAVLFRVARARAFLPKSLSSDSVTESRGA